MPNQIAKHKKNYSFLLEKKLIARVDAEATRLGQNRTDIVKKALRQYLNMDPVPITSNDVKKYTTELADIKASNLLLHQNLQELNNNQKQLHEEIAINRALPEPKEQTNSKKGFWARLLGK